MIKESVPKISCVTVTTGRSDLIKDAIRCYTMQSYTNREMIILSQGSDEDNKSISDHVKSLGRNDILFYTAPSDLSLGAMRNTSIELSHGDVICQWDDDDLYHPDRLRTQYLAMRSSSKNVGSAYSAFIKYFKTTGEIYWCDWIGEGSTSSRLLCGAVMFYKQIFHDHKNMLYPESGNQCHVEEDLNVLQKLLRVGNVVPLSQAHQYFYTYHGENTYDLEHHKLTLLTNSGKVVLDSERLLGNQQLLTNTFRELQMDPVSVKSKDEFAFTYSS